MRLFVALGCLALAGAAGLAAVAQVASPPTAVGASATGFHVLASATNVQSFLWMIDDGSRAITFCFTLSNPPTGPQYDFSCKTKSFGDAQIH